jgi:hypothetical protein
MSMSIELVKIEKDSGGFSLWVSDEQELSSSTLLKVLSPLGIIESFPQGRLKPKVINKGHKVAMITSAVFLMVMPFFRSAR